MRLYLYRAKVKIDENEIPSKIAWRYGSLNRVECMGNPLGDFREQYEKDHYQIITRNPNSVADWGLPYSQACYPVVDLNTIGMYVGAEDSNEIPIFEGDYVTWQGRVYIIVYNKVELCYMMEKIPKTYQEPITDIRFNSDWASSVTVCGNKWDGYSRGGKKNDLP